MIVLGILLPVVVLFPFYLIRGMGAGDIKLLSMIGLYVSLKDLAAIFVISVCIGAVIGIFKILLGGGVKERIRYIRNLIGNVILIKDGRETQSGALNLKDNPRNSVVHFSVPILLGAVLVTVRHYLYFMGGI